MDEIDSALDDIAHIREQLAAGSRFQGLAPGVVALTGVLALALATWQADVDDKDLVAWVWLAVASAVMIGTEAIVRARTVHKSMAARLLGTTLNRFMPAAMAGAIVGVVVLARSPEYSALLPGVWQLLIGVGIFAILAGLPRQMIWAAGFYFASATVSLVLGATDYEAAMPWLMGVPFGLGQLLVAAILHLASRDTAHGQA